VAGAVPVVPVRSYAGAMAADGSGQLLAGLLPAGVAVAESFGDEPDADLRPEEAAAVAGAAERRRREFAAVRACARAALVALGVPPVAVPPDVGAEQAWARRAPVWPQGVTGSMTHCDGYRAAAVTRLDVLAAVGVDAEPHDRLPDGVQHRVTLGEERAMLAALTAERDDIAWDRVLFSAKESVFKAWFPLAQRWLGFEECRVELDVDGSVRASLLVPGPVVDGVRIGVLHGRWRALRTHVGTAIIVPAGAPSRRSPC
jgi:4'-phosphopantetheinyl transferase EntD